MTNNINYYVNGNTAKGFHSFIDSNISDIKVLLLKGISQSDLIRQAIDDLLARTGKINKSGIIDDIAGIWANSRNIPDIRKLRSGWSNRPSR